MLYRVFIFVNQLLSLDVQLNEHTLHPGILSISISNLYIIKTKQTTWAFKYNFGTGKKISLGSTVLVPHDYNGDMCKVKYVT